MIFSVCVKSFFCKTAFILCLQSWWMSFSSFWTRIHFLFPPSFLFRLITASKVVPLPAKKSRISASFFMFVMQIKCSINWNSIRFTNRKNCWSMLLRKTKSKKSYFKWIFYKFAYWRILFRLHFRFSAFFMCTKSFFSCKSWQKCKRMARNHNENYGKNSKNKIIIF